MSVRFLGVRVDQGLLFHVVILTPTHVLPTICPVHIVTIVSSDHLSLAPFHIHLILLTPARSIEILRVCLFHSFSLFAPMAVPVTVVNDERFQTSGATTVWEEAFCEPPGLERYTCVVGSDLQTTARRPSTVRGDRPCDLLCSNCATEFFPQESLQRSWSSNSQVLQCSETASSRDDDTSCDFFVEMDEQQSHVMKTRRRWRLLGRPFAGSLGLTYGNRCPRHGKVTRQPSESSSVS